MGAIICKEWKSFFVRKFGWLCLSVTTCVIAIVTLFNNLLAGSADLTQTFFFSSIPLVVVLPILCSRIFTKELKKESTWFLLSLPVSKTAILLGKFTALYLLMVLSSGLFYFIPLLLSGFGSVNFATAYVSVLGFDLFLCALLAISTFFALLFKRPWLAALVGSLALTACYAVGALANVMPELLSAILYPINPYLHFGNLLCGHVDVSAVLYFLLTAAIFLVASVLLFKRNMASPIKPTAITLLALTVFVSLAVNVASVFIPTWILKPCVSGDETYRVSEESEQALSNLDGDVTVTCYCQGGRPCAGINLSYFLSQYESISDRVTVKYESLKNAPLDIRYTGGGVLVEGPAGSNLYSYQYFKLYYTTYGFIPQSEYESYVSAYQAYEAAVEAGEDPEVTEEIYYGFYYSQYSTGAQLYFTGEAFITNAILTAAGKEANFTGGLSPITAESLTIPSNSLLLMGMATTLMLPIVILLFGSSYLDKRKKSNQA